MANLNLVTGFRGEPHVTAADQGSFNASIFGEGEYVMRRGKEFEASIITNNLVRVLDGDLMIQGRHARLNDSLYVDMAIENGEQGLYRNDLIVARYSKEISTGVEQANLIVLKGTSSASAAADPVHTVGNIFDGDAVADFPLYRVRLNGLNIEGLDKLFGASNGSDEDGIQVELLSSGWEGDKAPYTQSLEVSNIPNSSIVIADIDMSVATEDTAGTIQDSWSCVGRINITDGVLTATCFENKPDVDLIISLGVIR